MLLHTSHPIEAEEASQLDETAVMNDSPAVSVQTESRLATGICESEQGNAGGIVRDLTKANISN